MATPHHVATSLTSRGYGIPKSSMTEDEIALMRKELTMVPINNMLTPQPHQRQHQQDVDTGSSKPFPLFQESASKLYVPKYFGLQRFGVPSRCGLAAERVDHSRLDFSGSIRTEQHAPVSAFMAAARDPLRMGGILSLPCGFGKTVIALHLIGALKMRTIIVIHKEFLLNQWRDRIAQFLPNARVGMVKASVTDVEGKDIVLASLQSLAMKDYEQNLFDGFGFLIIDECHRVGTEVFSRALHKINTYHSLGLSATVKRKDGMTKAFVSFLGDVVFKVKRAPEVVRVVQYSYWNADPAYSREESMRIAGVTKPNSSRMINNITSFGPRIKHIVDVISAILRHPDHSTRRVLVLSDRKRQLELLHEGLDELGVSSGFYWGGMKAAALAETETKTVMLATFSYASEGMDVPGLDTLVLASPKSDIEQSCGRILRQKADQRANVPLIYDVVDDFSLFARQGTKRRDYFKKNQYAFCKDLTNALIVSTTSLTVSTQSDEDDD